ncbi:MAG: hypothetical protein H0V17_29360, partial [Deltaproteobacteria bacterium]|nr:hypothetical protein [Deltaproteobacteria bacterium]
MRFTTLSPTALSLLSILSLVACVPDEGREPSRTTKTCDADDTNVETIEEDLVIKTPADLDDLPTKCWDLRGKLTLQGTNIISLEKLNKLVGMDELEIVGTKLTKLDTKLYVYETVTITGNDVLADLDQLEVDQNIAVDVTVDDNLALIDLGGLADLDKVSGDLTISRNAKLPSLAMRQLDEVGGTTRIATNAAMTSIDLGRLDTVHRFELIDNVALTTFGGFPARSIIGDLTVRGNKALTSLGTMSSLETIQGNLTIDNNSALTTVGLFTSTMKYLTGVLAITNNAQLTDLGQLSHLTGIGAITINTNTKLPFCKAQEIQHCVPQHGSVSILNNQPNSPT